MNILVAGGAGFLGSHLCDYLLEKGHTVTCIDNLITGSIDNIKHIKSNKFAFILHDIINQKVFMRKIDFIFNLASPASPVAYAKYPIETLQTGAIGTDNLLGIAREHDAGFLMASTSEVYGDPHVNPQFEEYWGNVNPIGERSVYDEAKRYAEALTMAYHRTYNINIKIARIFNTYGPRMTSNDGRVIPNFICQALLNEDITIYGDGSQSRSFCYVTDEIDGLYRLMMSNYNLPVNIGNPVDYTMYELAEKVIKLTGSDSCIVYEKLPADDPKVRRPDITKAQELLKWEPKVMILNGLSSTIEYFKKELLQSDGKLRIIK